MYLYPTRHPWQQLLLSWKIEPTINMYSHDLVFAATGEIRSLQEKKLQETIQYLAGHSPFYKELFDGNGIQPDMIRSLDDLQKIPVTSKEDLQLRNWDFLCVPRNRISEYMSSSGTLGSPVTIALTENDLSRLSYNEYCSFLSAGGSKDDIYQLMLTLDRQFMAGIAYYLGIRQLGAGLVRVGPGAPFLQYETIRRVNPTVIIGVPSFLVKLVEFAEANKVNLAETSVKTALCIGESIRLEDGRLNRLGQRITGSWPINLVSTYASTEMQTAFTECPAGHGGHLMAELLILELLDEFDQPVAPGQAGEVTITTLGVEGMPLLRYKTGDICRRIDNPCSCGRNTPRLTSVIGRKKQMIKLKGTTFYPPALYDVLHEIPEITDYVVELQTNEFGTDEVIVHVHVNEPSEPLSSKIREFLRSRLRVVPDLVFAAASELHHMQFPEGGRKAQKLIDNRLHTI
ncbi:phenylacetate--CoA ligase family protein [Flavihumibacter profundi]|uniref:phenylacetate--CoA ligase family protein n=1 Tax=Flavihumibacter profundi TaxID=2716883 RepID=UPI001CC34EFA|nr:AMP-binding protein [Flavihumibacter profundi]MBZ5858871.1 AMP-binding protein [Flavihumibacter profundi]